MSKDLSIILKAEIDKITNELREIKKELDRAKRIGMDITALTQTYESRMKQVELIKKVYEIKD